MLKTSFTTSKNTAENTIPTITTPVVCAAFPAVGHSIKPTSSLAPAKMFIPSSALASFCERSKSPGVCSCSCLLVLVVSSFRAPSSSPVNSASMTSESVPSPLPLRLRRPPRRLLSRLKTRDDFDDDDDEYDARNKKKKKCF